MKLLSYILTSFRLQQHPVTFRYQGSICISCIRPDSTLHPLWYKHLLDQMLRLACSSCCCDVVAWVNSFPQWLVNDSYCVHFRRNNLPNNCSHLEQLVISHFFWSFPAYHMGFISKQSLFSYRGTGDGHAFWALLGILVQAGFKIVLDS